VLFRPSYHIFGNTHLSYLNLGFTFHIPLASIAHHFYKYLLGLSNSTGNSVVLECYDVPEAQKFLGMSYMPIRVLNIFNDYKNKTELGL